ncbi:MAG: hypothetical protein HY673_03800 [Chloroflexi bacterium]|nr:hypothetical protein [Chloroflexota bacterium]
MGKGDYRWRETKKQKKDSKKIITPAVLLTVPEVEVIKTKGKKEKPPEEE